MEVMLEKYAKRTAFIEDWSTELFSVNKSTISCNNFLNAFYFLPHQSFNQQRGHFIAGFGSERTF